MNDLIKNLNTRALDNCFAGLQREDSPLALATVLGRQVHELAFAAHPVDVAVGDARDTGRVIATIFEPFQPVDEPRSNRAISNNSNDSTHVSNPTVLRQAEWFA